MSLFSPRDQRANRKQEAQEEQPPSGRGGDAGFPRCQGPGPVRGGPTPCGDPRGLPGPQQKQGGPRGRPGGNLARAAQEGREPGLAERSSRRSSFPQDALWLQEVSNLSEWLSPGP